jgi:hypothetical protein
VTSPSELPSLAIENSKVGNLLAALNALAGGRDRVLERVLPGAAGQLEKVAYAGRLR